MGVAITEQILTRWHASTKYRKSRRMGVWLHTLVLHVVFGPMPRCLEWAATEVVAPGGTQSLANMSTGAYFAWPPGDTPLQVANSTAGMSRTSYPMAVLVGIGPPSHRYVVDIASEALIADGVWDIADLATIAAAAGGTLPSGGTFVDVGAHVGSWSTGFARAGFRVIAIEPCLPNLAALQATRCMNTDMADRITVVPVAVGAPAQRDDLCSLLSASNNDLGNCALRCTSRNSSSFAAAVEKHTGALSSGQGAVYFHHHRRYSQLLPPPSAIMPPPALLTLDELLLEGPVRQQMLPAMPPLKAIEIVKVDTAGSECDVLEGAKHSLLRWLRPTYMVVSVTQPAVEACVRSLAAQHHFDVFPLSTPDAGLALARKASRGKHVVLADTGRGRHERPQPHEPAQ